MSIKAAAWAAAAAPVVVVVVVVGLSLRSLALHNWMDQGNDDARPGLRLSLLTQLIGIICFSN